MRSVSAGLVRWLLRKGRDNIIVDFYWLILFNPNKLILWKDNYECIWKSHGVWEEKDGLPNAVKNEYFKKVNGNNKIPTKTKYFFIKKTLEDLFMNEKSFLKMCC